MIPRLVALAIIDIVVLALCAAAGASAGGALAAHASLSLLGYAVWLRGGGTIGVAPAILGVLGPLAILAALPAARSIAPRAVADDDAVFGIPRERTAQSGASLAVARMLDGRVLHATPDTLGSLVTIMRHGDVAARRRALETVVRSFEPALSPLIALALTDSDQTIRALAAAASARVAQNLTVARVDLAVKADSVALATLLADHARADVLLSDSQRAHLRDDAVATIAAIGVAHRDTHAVLMMEALWAAGDHAGIDRIVAATGVRSDAADWWRTEAAA